LVERRRADEALAQQYPVARVLGLGGAEQGLGLGQLGLAGGQLLPGQGGIDAQQGLAGLHRIARLDQHAGDAAIDLGGHACVLWGLDGAVQGEAGVRAASLDALGVQCWRGHRRARHAQAARQAGGERDQEAGQGAERHGGSLLSASSHSTYISVYCHMVMFAIFEPAMMAPTAFTIS